MGPLVSDEENKELPTRPLYINLDLFSYLILILKLVLANKGYSTLASSSFTLKH